ncbi:hypothetical protein ARMGADRAFT_450305 [Armillaria gallica]|uniref:Uncharacterized protein n=1 Tax=Armillaria gallica TaxID=47427 RepID=A0A2H3DHC8_ARMGA|nr:hypothetical protein ARMGADRAFT_450305 [Armillaria gallica]
MACASQRYFQDLINSISEDSDSDSDSGLDLDTRTFTDKDSMCFSPDAGTFCTGLCKISGEPPKGANVVCISSCKDSQSTWEIEGKGYSMTNVRDLRYIFRRGLSTDISIQVLIEYCRRQHHHPTLEKLMLHVIQETRKTITNNYSRRQSYAKKMKAWYKKNGSIPISDIPIITSYLGQDMKQDPQVRLTSRVTFLY